MLRTLATFAPELARELAVLEARIVDLLLIVATITRRCRETGGSSPYCQPLWQRCGMRTWVKCGTCLSDKHLNRLAIQQASACEVKAESKLCLSEGRNQDKMS